MKASEILDEAKQLLVERGSEYGDSTLNHIQIARLWSVYLDKNIEPHEVAICLLLWLHSKLYHRKADMQQIQQTQQYLIDYVLKIKLNSR